MKKLFLAALMFVPVFAFANVRINEIAWMGTPTSSSDEWIELYNDGDVPVDLTGWSLSISSKKLSGSIQPKGFFLLERTDDTTVPNIPADIIYTGALSDSGIKLVLQDASGAEVNSVDASLGWPKGNNTTKETMQWNGSVWITAEATPRAENKTIDTTTEKTMTETPAAVTPTSTVDTSAHMSPLPLSDFSQKQELFLSAGRSRIVPVGIPVNFEAYAIDAKGNKFSNISATWSFGDGGQAGGMKVSHAYRFPGDYAVILSANAGGNDAVARAEIKVFTPEIRLGSENDTAYIENNAEYEMNVGGFFIGSFLFPADTIIKPNAKIFLSDVKTSDEMKLELSDGTVLSRYEKTLPMAAILATTTPPIEKQSEPVAVIIKPETYAAAVVSASPEKPKVLATTTRQTITLKKPEGFFAKLWHSLFR